MNKKIYLLIVIFTILYFNNYLDAQVEYFHGGSICNESEWELVFEDEFEGNSIDTAVWFTYQPFGNGPEDDQCPNCRTHFFNDSGGIQDDNSVMLDKNVVVYDGYLKLLVYREDITFHEREYYYSSSNIESKRKFPAYSKFEIKCKISGLTDFSKVFWTFGWDTEIDIFESWTYYMNLMSVVNWKDGKGIHCSEEIYPSINPDDFHVYTAEYEKYYTKFWIDNNLVLVLPKYENTVVGLDYECELNSGYYIKKACYPIEKEFPYTQDPLSVVAGNSTGKWVGKEDYDEGDLCDEFVVDYIRVYKRCTPFDDLIVNDGEDLTITGDHSYSSITLEPNSTLNINNANINMNTNGRINVNNNATLNVSNTTIAPICDQWDGIIGWWNGKIFIDDDTYILQANKAIYLKNDSKANINNTTIENCDIGFLLKNIEDSCNIINVDFKNNVTAIEIEKSNGISISHSKFSDNKYGINSFESFIDVSENNFFIDNLVYDIKIDGTFPTSAGANIGKIGGIPNKFVNGGYKGQIRSSGNDHPEAVNIINNVFGYSSHSAIKIIGNNKIDVANNKFDKNCGVVEITSTGAKNLNKLICNNYIDDGQYNNIFYGDNGGTSFLGNQFVEQYWSNFVIVEGSIQEILGSYNNPAGNCFGDKTSSIETFYSKTFIYNYHDNGTSGNCEKPNNPLNYTALRSDLTSNQCDGNIGPFDEIDPDGDGDDGIDSIIIACCIIDILDSVDTWIVDVVGKGGDNPKTTVDERVNTVTPELLASEVKLDQWINFGIYAALKTENYNFAEQLLTPLVTMKWKKKLYGIKVRQKKYNEAKEILNSLPQNNQDQIYFKNVQEINLKRFIGVESGEWMIDEADISLLKLISQSKYPAKGFANGLYTRLTGELLPLNIPDFEKGIKYRESKNTSKEVISYQFIYPNPASKDLNIRVGDEVNTMVIELFDITGGKVLSKKVNSSYTKIDVSNFISGVYLITILKDDGTKINKKVYIK